MTVRITVLRSKDRSVVATITVGDDDEAAEVSARYALLGDGRFFLERERVS